MTKTRIDEAGTDTIGADTEATFLQSNAPEQHLDRGLWRRRADVARRDFFYRRGYNGDQCPADGLQMRQNGRASSRERWHYYVWISAVSGSVKKKIQQTLNQRKSFITFVHIKKHNHKL